MAYTPGPWVVGISIDRDWPVFRLKEMGTNDPESTEVQANRAIIEAAPDLLEALRNLHNWGETFFHGHPKAMTEAGELLKRLDALHQERKGRET